MEVLNITNIPAGKVHIRSKDEMYLCLDDTTDSHGDRKSLATNSKKANVNLKNHIYIWELIEKEDVLDGKYYLIVNNAWNHPPLKPALKEDKDGDWQVWGDSDGDVSKDRERRFHWKMIPTEVEGFYTIRNLDNTGCLKTAAHEDFHHNHLVFVNNPHNPINSNRIYWTFDHAED